MDPKCDHCPLAGEDRPCLSYPVLCGHIKPAEGKSAESIARRMVNWHQVNKTSPTLMQQAASLAGSLFNFFKSGLKVVDEETYRERYAVCEACPNWNPNKRQCTICKCRTDYKLKMASEKCPEDRWLPVATVVPVEGSNPESNS